MEHTIFGLIKKRAEIAGQHKLALKTTDTLKADLEAIDRALVLCGYEEDPKGIAPRGKYKQLFGRNELKLTIIKALRVAPVDDETIAAQIIAASCIAELGLSMVLPGPLYGAAAITRTSTKAPGLRRPATSTAVHVGNGSLT